MLFDKLTCVRIEKISSVLHQVRVIFKTFISDLSLLQQMSGKLISFSTVRHNVYLIQFTKVRYLLLRLSDISVIVLFFCFKLGDIITAQEFSKDFFSPVRENVCAIVHYVAMRV